MSHDVGMSSCCLSGKVHQGQPAGREDEIGGLSTYISEPENHSKSKSIIFITDSTSHLQLHTTMHYLPFIHLFVHSFISPAILRC